MVVYDKKYPVKTLLKKRFQLLPKYPKLKFGESGLSFGRNIRFEFIYFLFIRKFLKKILKRKKGFYKNTKAWVFIRPNHVMTKKSKNSRMGKGKGAFVRWCSIIQKGFIFIEFENISTIRLKKYSLKLEKKFKVPLHLITSNNLKTKNLQKKFLGSSINSPLTPYVT